MWNKHKVDEQVMDLFLKKKRASRQEGAAPATPFRDFLRIGKRELYWICQICGWALYGLYLGFMLGGSDSELDALVKDIVFTTSCLLLLSHLYRNYIVAHGWLRMLFGKLLVRIVTASFLLSLTVIPIGLLSIQTFDPGKLDTALNIEAVVSSALGGTFVFFCWSLCYFLYHYVSNYNRNLKWEALINEFELNKLRSQLNPHFIFNALNSVRVLVDENPKKAKDSISQLSNILRSSLLMDKKKVISFEEELQIVKDYLALEGTRFEERLQTAIEVEKECLSYKVPPMMLQTLVENGIKHGVSKLKSGGSIQIRAFVKDGAMVCQIRNSGHYVAGKVEKEGYGLKSTIQRLDLLYRGRASFSIANESDEVVLVEITIPVWDESELSVANLPPAFTE